VHEDNRFALAGDPILGHHPVDYELPNLHANEFASRRTQGPGGSRAVE
jgi:hypothetical protein